MDYYTKQGKEGEKNWLDIGETRERTCCLFFPFPFFRPSHASRVRGGGRRVVCATVTLVPSPDADICLYIYMYSFLLCVVNPVSVREPVLACGPRCERSKEHDGY